MDRRILLVALFLGASAFAQTAPAPPEPRVIPVRSFTRFEEFAGMKISPDGKYLALLTGNGNRTIAFLNVAADAVDYAFSAPQNVALDEFDWISPTRLLVTVTHRYSELQQPYPSGLAFAIERDGGKMRDLYCCEPVGLYEMPVFLRASRNELLGFDGERHLIIADHDIRRGRLA